MYQGPRRGLGVRTPGGSLGVILRPERFQREVSFCLQARESEGRGNSMGEKTKMSARSALCVLWLWAGHFQPSHIDLLQFHSNKRTPSPLLAPVATGFQINSCTHGSTHFLLLSHLMSSGLGWMLNTHHLHRPWHHLSCSRSSDRKWTGLSLERGGGRQWLGGDSFGQVRRKNLEGAAAGPRLSVRKDWM